jgi:serine/threonine-protein kinase
MAESENSLDDRLAASSLVTAEQVARFREALGAGADDATLLKRLVHAGLVTKWQATQVAAGKERGLILEHYKLLDPIGAGGMGQVFRAHDTELNRQVAVKILPRRSMSRDAIERFRREGAASLRVQHEHIVRSFELGEQRDTHFLVMELVVGTNLAKYITKKGRLGVRETARIGYEVSLALDHARTCGIIHRDIKPSNILLTREGAVKLADLGLAKLFGATTGAARPATLTHSGAFMGTVDYCAPEQAEDAKRADTRSDLYSLGCTLYHCLTGQPPFPRGTDVQKIVAHREQDPTPIYELNSDVPPSFSDLIHRRMLAKRPDERFQNPAESATALHRWISGEPGSDDLSLLGALIEEELGAEAARASSKPPERPSEPPHREADARRTKGLLRDPERYRSGRAMGTVKGIRRYLDVAGRLVEPKRIALSAVVILGLVLAAIYGARNVLETRYDPAARLPSPTDISNAGAARPTANAGSIESQGHDSSRIGEKQTAVETPEPNEKPIPLTEWLAVPTSTTNSWQRTQTSARRTVSTGSGSSGLWHPAVFEDFELRLEFRTDAVGDGGVWFRAPYRGDGMHLQIRGQAGSSSKDIHFLTGALYGYRAPDRDVFVRDEWNRLHVHCQEMRLRVELNGQVIHDLDLTKVEPDTDETRVTRPVRRTGYVGLDSWSGTIEYRNVQITPIGKPVRTEAVSEAIEVTRYGSDSNTTPKKSVSIANSPREQPRWLISTAEQRGHSWEFVTVRTPLSSGWEKPGFPRSFKQGRGVFGNGMVTGVKQGVLWTSKHIYLRTTVEIPSLLGKRLVLRHIHDDDAWLYVNGAELDLRPGNGMPYLWGYSHGYREIRISQSEHSKFRKGNNVISVHCQQNSGPQVIDIGLRLETE